MSESLWTLDSSNAVVQAYDIGILDLISTLESISKKFTVSESKSRRLSNCNAKAHRFLAWAFASNSTRCECGGLDLAVRQWQSGENLYLPILLLVDCLQRPGPFYRTLWAVAQDRMLASSTVSWTQTKLLVPPRKRRLVSPCLYGWASAVASRPYLNRICSIGSYRCILD